MLLFIDESGHDHKAAPYEVLAGVAIRERDLWNLIQAIRNAELEFLGLHMADVDLEMKGRKLLKRKYFLESEKGYQRSARVVPEPFFVHSDLTTVVQIADLAAYCVNWGLRLKGMTQPTRTEIAPLARMVYDMKFVGKWFDELSQQEKPLYGIFYVDDLRPKRERTADG